tara:strand:- start:736 stop:1257 length:522 start_codon:yes stop_codon:yes gene_type:complete
MKNLKILNSKQLKPIKQLLKQQFDADFDFSKYAVLLSSKDKIYIANKDIFTDKNLDLYKLRVNSIGIYFAYIKNNELRLSIEGSQLVGPIAKTNIITLSDKEFNQWIQGIDIDKSAHKKPSPSHPPKEKQQYNSITNNKFVIIKHNTDYIGCGKTKDNRILNFVPKTRRIRVK